ncbi:MAG: gliding motility-associated C-terminal domain-containing protein [Flavobacteriales bacterium]|nr:gliding motility-associated C-terminal domain-containing protein [Flavobacteriales bacterium]
MKGKPIWAAIAALLFFATGAQAQYVTNGTAAQLSCNCYRLTLPQVDQFGSVWNENMISLDQPFDFTFDVFLGTDNGGADGIAFVLQPISTSIGVGGGGLGYQGIDPSVSIEIDTYQNGSNGDPQYDHVAIMANGNSDHNSPQNLAGPISALPLNLNIEDGQEHLLRISWNPVGQILRVYIDGFLRLEYTGDIVTQIFGNDPMVFWGFTGSTGGLYSAQRFCLSILPGMEVTVSQICAGDSVMVLDSSYSALGSIAQWQWDFGNGQTSMAEDPGFVTFPDPGQFYIVQSIVDAAGCDAMDSTLLVVLPNPVAAFTAVDACDGDPVIFTDQSTAQTGNINSWHWDFGAGSDPSPIRNPSLLFPHSGPFDVQLTVTTAQGCSGQVTQQVNVNPLPQAMLDQSSAGAIATFQALTGPDETAQWFLGDTIISEASFQLTFPDSGWHSITLVITTQFGCTDTLIHDFHIDAVSEFLAPNVFTPDGDNVNDRFEPYTYAVNEANLHIFNRWGRPVFSFEGPLATGAPWGWDGTVNDGAEAAAGTYYFMLDLTGADGAHFNQRGTVTLLR